MKYTSNKYWDDFFYEESQKEYFIELMIFIESEYKEKIIFPKYEKLFCSFNLINPLDIKVILLGQDPYHSKGHANGLSFSSDHLTKTPHSLKNIFKELKSDLDIDHFNNNSLEGWTKQGVFLINSIFSVQEGKPLSHKNKGWEIFTKNCLSYIYKINNSVIFLIFGKYSLKMIEELDITTKNIVVTGHPSPFSYEKHFKGTKPFSQVNSNLVKLNKNPINWEK